MNENGNKYALAALKDRRASLAGEIASLKKQTAWREEQLLHLDATIRLFDPNAKPEALPLKRPRRIKLFKQGELNRMIFDALRVAGEPLSTAQITTAVMQAMGCGLEARSAIFPRVRGNLGYLQHDRKSVIKSGTGQGVRWALLDFRPTPESR
jgi:hypothetical protein